MLRLGHALRRVDLSRVHGNRPVTLVGYGMGARVILKCLLALSDAPSASGLGIVETAVLMGAPYPADALEWARASSVCAYRLVNAFNARDWLLGFAYRATTASVRGIAGLRAVECINGSDAVLHNVDLTPVLTPSHFQYRDKLGALVQALGVHSGIVDLSCVPTDDQLTAVASTLVTRVKNSAPALPALSELPAARPGGLRESAAQTLERLQFWKVEAPPCPLPGKALARSASEDDLAASMLLSAEDPASPTPALAGQGGGTLQWLGQVPPSLARGSLAQDGDADAALAVPRPHSR